MQHSHTLLNRTSFGTFQNYASETSTSQSITKSTECVELYLYSHYTPLWHAQAQLLPLHHAYKAVK